MSTQQSIRCISVVGSSGSSYTSPALPCTRLNKALITPYPTLRPKQLIRGNEKREATHSFQLPVSLQRLDCISSQSDAVTPTHTHPVVELRPKQGVCCRLSLAIVIAYQRVITIPRAFTLRCLPAGQAVSLVRQRTSCKMSISLCYANTARWQSLVQSHLLICPVMFTNHSTN